MYIPEHFRMSEEDVSEFLSTQRTGTLVTYDPVALRPVAGFLPWAFVNGDTLTSHIGKTNEQARHAGQALVVLMGDDAYVPGAWLKKGSASSWVYETVHLYGQLTIHEDPQWIKQSWADMMERFSEGTLADYDPDWLDRQAKACLGVEFTITEIQGKSRLSQNRRVEEVRSVADHLESRCPALATRIRDVSIPHIEARDKRVSEAKPYTP